MIRESTTWRRRAWAIAAFASVLVTARIGSTETGVADPRWNAGRPIAIAVKNGRATFDVPDSGPGSQTVVIVSVLDRGPGPFPIRLSTRSVDSPEPPRLAPRPPARLPRRDAPRVGPVPERGAVMPPDRRSFDLMINEGDPTVANSYRSVAAKLRAVGGRVQVYVDVDDLAIVEDSTLRDVVSTFDDRIFPITSSRFGTARDVDGDGRFTIFLSSWLGRLAGGRISVDGFVKGSDLEPTCEAPFGNRCDMMCLNSGLKSGPYLRTIMAHEYTHAITYSRKSTPDEARGHARIEEEGWLDEALAHLVEDEMGFSRSNIDYRVSAYLCQPESYRLVVDDYYAADLFRSHGNRGATYLFLRWCVDRYGSKLIDELILSRRHGVENLEAATGTTFADLFRRWTVALYLSGLDPANRFEDGYRSVDLRGEMEDWVLAGPRASVVEAGEPAEAWSAAGTTTHFTVVSGSARVEVESPPGVELQVTAVPLPTGMGRPELSLRLVSGQNGDLEIQAQVLEKAGIPVRLGYLGWERLVPPANPRTTGFRRDGIDMLGIASSFGSSSLPANGRLLSRPIRLATVRPSDGPIAFKAVGTDRLGRRVASWAVVEIPPRLVSAKP